MKKNYKIYIGLFLFGFLLINNILAQQELKNGRVITTEGYSVEGAMVSLVGKDVSTTTDKGGYFNISAGENDILEISAGLVSMNFSVKKDKADYVLEGYHKQLAWGLGDKQSFESNTAAITTVYGDQLSKNSVINPENALFGQLSGLTVLQNGGTPWSRNPNILVRGVGALEDGDGGLGNNAVLVLVDGIERPLSSLVIDEIESVSVLKDAAALAIYGQRGANGAIVVTTKRGEFNSFKVDASYQYGMNTPTHLPKMANAYEYAMAVNEANQLNGDDPIYSQWDLNDYKNGNQPYFFPNVNWVDETLKDYGVSTNFNTQVRGGGKTIRYYTSVNYQTEEGFFNHTDFDSRYDSQLKYTRLNVRANIDANVTPSTIVSVNISASLSDRKYPFAGVNNIIKAMYNTPSGAYPVRTMNGHWGGTDLYDNNPVASIAATGYRQDFNRQSLGDLTINQDLSKLIEGLSAEGTLAYDNSATFNEGLKKTYEYETVNVIRDQDTGLYTDTISTLLGRENDLDPYDEGHSDLSQWRHATLRLKLKYQKRWERSMLSSSLLYSQDKHVKDGQYHTYLRQNIAGHVSYDFNSKYFADLTVSYAGSSSLPDGDQFGLFPAISAGWLISEEDFLSSVSFVNELKMRASYGLTGSDIMPSNLFDQKFTNGGKYYFGSNYAPATGIIPGRLATTNLTYETSQKSNIGLDMILIDHLNMTLDAYFEKRKNILVNSDGVISEVIGVDTPYKNDGEVKNKGFEADIIWKDKVGSLSYYIGGNFSYTKSEVVNRNEQYRPYSYLNRTGQPVGQQFGLEAIGLFKDEQDIANSPEQRFSEVRPGDIKYKDQNNDGIIDSYDEVPIGYSSLYPEIYYAGKIGFEVKGFGVDAIFQGIANQTIYLNTPSVFWPLMDNTNISEYSLDKTWSPNRTEAKLPRLTSGDNQNNYRKNTIWLAKANYLKLRSLNIYYNLPEKLVSKVRLGNAQVFARGMNLFSIDDIDVIDPESKGAVYPSIASYHFGVKIGF